MPRTIKCLKIPLITLMLCVFSCSAGFAAKTQTFAYLLLDSSAVMQCRVDQSGKFIPLKPPVFYTGNESSHKLVVSPNGKYAYIIANEEIIQCKINPDGTLALLRRDKYPNSGSSSDGMIDSDGKHLYIAGVLYKAELLQYEIGKDGRLLLISKPGKEVHQIGYHVTPHPKLPYAYAAMYPNDDDRDAKLYSFKINGTKGLSEIAVTDNGGPMAFSSDGRFLYCSDRDVPSIAQYKVGKDGKLVEIKSMSFGYRNPVDHDEWDRTQILLTDMLVTRSGKTIFVSDRIYSGLYRFALDKNGRIEYKDSYWIDDRKLISDEALYKQAIDELRKQNPPVTDNKSIMNAYSKKIEPLARPDVIAEGPDGSLYAAIGKRIYHFRIDTDGSVKMMKPAYLLTKEWWKKYGQDAFTLPDGERRSHDALLCNLVIVHREAR